MKRYEDKKMKRYDDKKLEEKNTKKTLKLALEQALVELGFVHYNDEISKYDDDAIKLQKSIEDFYKKIR